MADDLTGRRFGRWLVISQSPIRKYKTQVAYDCVCDCGTRRLVSGSCLRHNHSASCGCAFKEAAAKSQITHGLTKHRLRGTWRSMKERCYNPNHTAYARYGGRGITVCKRWMDFATFVSDNEALALPGLTIDRRNNDGNYNPSNCRWVTRRQQTLNRDNNVWIEFRGKRLIAADWARETGLHAMTIRSRLHAGWPVELALTAPKVPPQNKRHGRPDA